MTRNRARWLLFGLLLAGAIVVSLGLLASASVAMAQTYGADLTSSGAVAMNSSYNSTNFAGNAFDDNSGTYWQSSGAPPGEWVGVEWATCVPECSDWQPKRIRQVSIQQGNAPAQNVTSFLLESANHTGAEGFCSSSTWLFQAELQITMDFGVHYYQIDPVNPDAYDCWRLVGNSVVTGGLRMQVAEIQMMEANPTPTPAPSLTLTPSITPTPSNTPTPTLDPFAVLVTSTQGASMRMERSADFGDLALFGGMMVIAVILALGFMYVFWKGRSGD